MSREQEAPPPGVELIPEDVQEEMRRIEAAAHKRLVQKIMEDHDFGRRLMENPEAALTEPGVLESLGVDDEVEGHRLYRSKWRWKCFYSYYRAWAHYRPKYGWIFS